jgi:hypothetical protein
MSQPPAFGQLVTLTSGHAVYFRGFLPDGRMKVRSKEKLHDFETNAARLPNYTT